MKPWKWENQGRSVKLYDGRDRVRAVIYANSPTRFTWYTFDEYESGGENDVSDSLGLAKELCVAAIVRQLQAPYGWEIKGW